MIGVACTYMHNCLSHTKAWVRYSTLLYIDGHVPILYTHSCIPTLLVCIRQSRIYSSRRRCDSDEAGKMRVGKDQPTIRE